MGYALAIEHQDYRRGMWIALHRARHAGGEAETRLWRFRALECFRRR